MELILIGRFRAKEGRETEAQAALREVVVPTRKEPGCLSIDVLRAMRDPRLFFIHARWKDEPSFDSHANQPHTIKFVKTMEGLIDHPWDTTRAEIFG